MHLMSSDAALQNRIDGPRASIRTDNDRPGLRKKKDNVRQVMYSRVTYHPYEYVYDEPLPRSASQSASFIHDGR